MSYVLNDISQLGLDIPTPNLTSPSTTVGSGVDEDFSKNKIIIKIKIWVFFVVFLEESYELNVFELIILFYLYQWRR